MKRRAVKRMCCACGSPSPSSVLVLNRAAILSAFPELRPRKRFPLCRPCRGKIRCHPCRGKIRWVEVTS